MFAGLLDLFKMASPNPNKFVPGNWIKAAKTRINSSNGSRDNFNQRYQRHYSQKNCENPGNLNEIPRRYFGRFQQQNSYSTNNFRNQEFTNNFRRKYSHSADFTQRRRPQVVFRNLRSKAYDREEDKHKDQFNLPSTSQSYLEFPIENKSQSWHDISLNRRPTNYHRGSEHLVRDWLTSDDRGRPVTLPKVPRSGEDDFNILSYNILSQRLLHNNMFLYEKCPPGVLPWDFRWGNLRREMEGFDNDIVCLQEVEDSHFRTHIGPWLSSRGYGVAYKKRSGHHRDKPDGVLTAWKRAKFRLLLSRPVEYFRGADKLTRFHNVGLISMLRANNGREVCVGNTHLLYNPKRGDIKLVQLATLFAEVDKVMTFHSSRRGERPPVVVCGDFNSTPGSPLYNFVTQGGICYKDIGIRSISGQGEDKNGPGSKMGPNLLPRCLGMNRDSTFVSERGQTGGSEYNLSHHLGALRSSGHEHRDHETTTMQNNGITVDFIFYSPPRRASGPNLGCAGLELKGRLSKSLAGEVRGVSGIPNHVHSSDHLPVISQFQFV